MSDQNKWSDDRYDDRYRQEEYRTESYGAPNPYGRDRDHYRSGGDRAYGDNSRGREAYGEGSQRYDRSRSEAGPYEDRAFTGGERTYDPYAATYGGHGEAYERGGRHGAPSYRPSDNRQAGGSLLHQGYRAPLGGLRGDAQGYSGVGGRDSAPYGSSVNRPDYGAYAGQERGLWDQTRDEVSSWFGDDEAARRRRADDMRHDLQGGEYRGEHRGRGPKGYTRSDDRIREDVSDRLTDDHMLDASDIEVKVTGGEVTLTGQIPDRYDKRRAEDLAEHVAGVKHVQNNLRVREQATTTQAGSTATTGSSGASGTGGSSARSN